ncbi:DNA primase [Anaerosalibacter sp. Marseille-P3206]|uniref:DNA primase n=1 Tax=Anaerosalibacter sp. Marseille-P3206 TaxID=1871005 RepID=UPI0009844CA5|nr:DNA primase [Anaerosalibacter sp. Marseille-P3206]
MNYLIDDEIIERVRSSSDIVEIISQYITLKKTGSNYTGLCPFHSEKTPSFTVSPAKQFYHCFGCGEGGDVISFIMKEENLSFPEAVKLLADRLGIIIEEKDDPKSRELKKKKELIYKINKDAARFFYQSLYNNEMGLAYLKKRSIDKKTMNKFGIGFADSSWDSLYRHLINKGYAEKDLESAGLIIKRKDSSGFYDRFRNRIIFPIIDTNRKVLAFGGRIIDSSMPKYLNSPETSVFLKGNNLFGLNIVNQETDRSKIVLVEGYMDVISLYNNGINYCVASLGTAFTLNQAKILKKFNDEIYICYDSDLAGFKATDRAMDILKEEGINAKVILLPSGKDPDDFVSERGKKGFEELLKDSLNYIDFKIRYIKTKYNFNEVEGKIQFAKEMGKFLKEIDSPIERDVFLDKIVLETGISKEAILKEFSSKFNRMTYTEDKYIKNKYRNNKDKIIPVKNVLEPAHLKAEKCIIYLIAKNEKIFKKIKDKLSPEDFLNYECRELAEFIFSSYEENQIINLKELYTHFHEIEDIDDNKMMEILNQNINISEEDIDSLIEDLIETIIYSKLKHRRNEITSEISIFESKKDKNERDVERFKQLCIELLEIDRKMN